MPTTGTGPYVGLRSFSEEDADFFFGRDREIRVISANLQAERLTVLYGPSGVGKSSVLQAGVVSAVTQSSNTVVYFRTWQNDSQVDELVERLNAFIQASRDRRSRPLFLLLDQFEEYLLNRPAQGIGGRFDSALARLINADDIPARILIGIREDGLSRLDQRFSLRVSNLFRNTLEIERLTEADARYAIERPLDVFNERNTADHPYAMEPALEEEILRQVRFGEAGTSESSGLGIRREENPIGRIETAFLQLVLKRLWDVEASEGSFMLRLDTLRRIGGASRILERHVNDVMAILSDEGARGIAARMFRYLVTPSRTKIPQATTDLVAYAEAPETAVRTVLNHLSDRQDSRILRRLAAPERYELYHDVLAQPILDWRRAYFEEIERAAREQELRVETDQKRREARTLRWLVGAMAAFLVATLVAAYIFQLGRRKAEYLTKQAQVATAQAQGAENRALSESLRAQAATAALEGKTQEAEKLSAVADTYKAQADAKTLEAEALRAVSQRNAPEASSFNGRPTIEPRAELPVQNPPNGANAASALQQQLEEMTRKLQPYEQRIELCSAAVERSDQQTDHTAAASTERPGQPAATHRASRPEKDI